VEEIELKPCPFCGNTKALQIMSTSEVREETCEWDMGHEESHTVICSVHHGGCGATCGYVMDDSVIKKWNTRAGA
jgi:hypothetical protein